jgi:isoamylase
MTSSWSSTRITSRLCSPCRMSDTAANGSWSWIRTTRMSRRWAMRRASWSPPSPAASSCSWAPKSPRSPWAY